MNNSLEKSENGFFYGIKKFFKSMFRREKTEIKQLDEKKETSQENSSLESLMIDDETREKYRLLELKNSFDQGLVGEENISERDKEALIKLYDEETDKLKNDTMKKANEIKKLLGV